MATFQIPWPDQPLVLEVPDHQVQARIQALALPTLGEPRELVQRAWSTQSAALRSRRRSSPDTGWPC